MAKFFSSIIDVLSFLPTAMSLFQTILFPYAHIFTHLPIPLVFYHVLFQSSFYKRQYWSYSSSTGKSLLVHHSVLLNLTFKAFCTLQSPPHLFSHFYSCSLPNHFPHIPEGYITDVNHSRSQHSYKTML